MRLTKRIIGCYLHPSQVQRIRSDGKATNNDEYVFRLQLEPDKFCIVRENSKNVVDCWLSKKDEVYTILNTARPTLTRSQFDKQTVQILFHGQMNVNEMMFSKHFAAPVSPVSYSSMSVLLPSTTEQSTMIRREYFYGALKSLFSTSI